MKTANKICSAVALIMVACATPSTDDLSWLDGLDNQSSTYYNPDYRKWGAWTGMNQRLVNWPLLKTGDTEAMCPQFNYFKNNYINAQLRTSYTPHTTQPSRVVCAQVRLSDMTFFQSNGSVI